MMNTLIAELEAATEGSRELDNAVAKALGFMMPQPGDPPRYSTSLDAALTLVPKGCGWSMNDDGEGFVFQKVKRAGGPGWPIIGQCDGDTTPALSLCICSLRARQAMKDAA